ncbi:MAG: hypothetical protein EU532_05755 [Promethearchaeota archaeon]|nr:MAG: hypothetical protein EU532_05755 [Candidatus Lokiarchaeota archaeon]
MPTFGHVFYGLCLLIPILYFARDKFNYKVGFIFLANNIFGPDILHLLFIPYFHNILGYAILAIPLSLVFTYSSRFSLVKSDGPFPLKFVDESIREVNWKNSYLISVAGGISHFFIDQFYHFEKEMHIWYGIDITHDEMLAWGGTAYHVVDPLMIIGSMIVVATILLSMYYLRKGYKETFKWLLFFTILTIVLMLGLSTAVYGGEREFGVMVHCTVYVLIPLFLLMYAARSIMDKPVKTPDIPKIDRKILLNIVAVISTLLGIFFLFYSYYALTYADSLAKSMAEDGGQTANEISRAITIIAYVYGIIAFILLIGSIGLFFKINICRYFVIVASLVSFIFGFPLAIALFLCEKDVKALFGKNSEE